MPDDVHHTYMGYLMISTLVQLMYTNKYFFGKVIGYTPFVKSAQSGCKINQNWEPSKPIDPLHWAVPHLRLFYPSKAVHTPALYDSVRVATLRSMTEFAFKNLVQLNLNCIWNDDYAAHITQYCPGLKYLCLDANLHAVHLVTKLPTNIVWFTGSFCTFVPSALQNLKHVSNLCLMNCNLLSTTAGEDLTIGKTFDKAKIYWCDSDLMRFVLSAGTHKILLLNHDRPSIRPIIAKAYLIQAELGTSDHVRFLCRHLKVKVKTNTVLLGMFSVLQVYCFQNFHLSQLSQEICSNLTCLILSGPDPKATILKNHGRVFEKVRLVAFTTKKMMCITGLEGFPNLETLGIRPPTYHRFGAPKKHLVKLIDSDHVTNLGKQFGVKF
jgi:hypothetical protein